jgi:hypothetical protein
MSKTTTIATGFHSGAELIFLYIRECAHAPLAYLLDLSLDACASLRGYLLLLRYLVDHLNMFSLETVQMFYNDAQAVGYKI